MLEQNSQQGSDRDEKNERKIEIPKLKTRLGFTEEVFVRHAKNDGRWTPTINELDELVVKNLVTFLEFRVLTYIKTRTINFRETDVRLKRKDIEDALKTARPNLAKAISELVRKKYLIEIEDKDSFYFYGLDPITFGGTIVFKSVEEAVFKMNRARKRDPKTVEILEVFREQLAGKRKTSSSEKLPVWEQKATALVAKSYVEDALTIQNYTAFEFLKYTLTKYTLSNGLSPQAGNKILQILGETKAGNPQLLIKNLVALMHGSPVLSLDIYEELKRAHSSKKTAYNTPLTTDAVTYVVTNWSQVKHHWQGLQHRIDQSPEAVQRRNDLAALIQEYPIESNAPGKVIPMRKA